MCPPSSPPSPALLLLLLALLVPSVHGEFEDGISEFRRLFGLLEKIPLAQDPKFVPPDRPLIPAAPHSKKNP